MVLKHLVNKNVNDNEGKIIGQVVVRGLMTNCTYFYVNENCLWVEALEDLDDCELKYLVCCYGDYQHAQRHYKDITTLTMEHTIVRGDFHCSRVFHYKREDWNLKHPPKEFRDSLHPS